MLTSFLSNKANLVSPSSTKNHPSSRLALLNSKAVLDVLVHLESINHAELQGNKFAVVPELRHGMQCSGTTCIFQKAMDDVLLTHLQQLQTTSN